MSAIYDNWERLVAAVLKKQQLWELFHAQSRSPSILSEASDFSSSRSDDLAFQGLSKSSNLVLISDFNPAVNVKDVYLASADLLGKGTFGSSYAAGMNSGVTILVKRLNSANISAPDFKRHMDVVGSLRHENVVSLRAYYYSGNENLLLYDYFSDGSVFALLHGRTGESRAAVDWHTRLKIAVGAARGIAQIHAQKLAHGNIKSSNVFMNEKKYGCVSDFGLAKIMKASFMPNAQYYAPEMKNNPQNVSQESDVYSFGVLLLELLTRKSPIGVTGGPESVDLVKLVSSVGSRLRISSVFDADLLKYPAIREQMVKVLQVGISCTTKSLERRPKMSDVVVMLWDLMDIILNPASSSISLKQNLIFFYNSSPTFDIDDLLMASGEVLGKGTFGTSYKVRWEIEEFFMVKRLRHVYTAQSDFHQHMMVIGRCRHINVTKLRTYYYSRDEKMLMYDYNEESVSNMLHGNIAKGRSLDWETRLRIAVGAARGLSYIHRQNGGNLVHGNVKSSNLFLNAQQYGLISDTGVVKVVSPIRRSVLQNSGYFAPEVKDARTISQPSDVYSFGIVLLELISSRPSLSVSVDGETTLLVNSIQSSIRDNRNAEVLDEKLRNQNEESMIEFLELALDCVNGVAEQRPGMPEVVRRLEVIARMESEELYIESGTITSDQDWNMCWIIYYPY